MDPKATYAQVSAKEGATTIECEGNQRAAAQSHNAFEDYLDAFAQASVTDQARLLRSSVADDVIYTNPAVEGRGLENLLAHISVFQTAFPGGYFRTNWIRSQHGQLLAEWTQFDQDGAELTTAHSYARVNEDGRLAHLAGFWPE